jgi:hypothetical protein
VGKMKVWNKATTTSLSGLHLGHHKCLIRHTAGRRRFVR